MTVKITLLFQDATNVGQPSNPNKRIGGWSESFYSPQPTAAGAIPAVLGTGQFTKGLAGYRATLLPQGGAIVGQRFQVVAPAIGPSQSLNSVFPGTYFSTAPEGSALLCKVPSLGASNIRRMMLRGLPTLVTVDGEYSPNSQWTADINNFFAFLSGYQFRGRDLSQPTHKIIDITAAGVVTSVDALPYALNSMIRILKTKDSSARLRGGAFQVSATGPSNTQVTLKNWTFGATTGGSIRLDAIVYPLIDSANISAGRLVFRKVGRPFTQFRGRRSARH